MIAILSPAKRMEAEIQKEVPSGSKPRFMDEAAQLVEKLRSYDVGGLKELMNVSDRIAELNHQRFAEWDPDPYEARAVPAILSYKGDVYQGFAAEEMSGEELLAAQGKVRVLSGLYGLLRPLDLILPYRLEMSTKLPNELGKDLYAFWGGRLTDALKEDMEEGGHRILIDLASNEYGKAIDKKGLPGRTITPVFKEKKDGAYKTIPMKAKRARGLMARFLVEEGVEAAEDLQGFDKEGYRYAPTLSEGDNMVFTREL